jgi:glycine/D-amino acid oxidase-like deaminating enzyme
MVSSVIVNPFEGQIDTGRMMQTLITTLGLLQIKVLTGANVEKVTELPNKVEVSVQSTFNRMTFTADKVAYCTNAFTKQFFPELDIEPGRGQVICTSPIDNLILKEFLVLMKVIIISATLTTELYLAVDEPGF